MLCEIGLIVDISLIVHFEKETFKKLERFLARSVAEVGGEYDVESAVADEIEALDESAEVSEPEELDGFSEAFGWFGGYFFTYGGDVRKPLTLGDTLRKSRKLLCVIRVSGYERAKPLIGNDEAIEKFDAPRSELSFFLSSASRIIPPTPFSRSIERSGV